MPGYDMSVTRAAMMSVAVTEPAKPSLLMLDDLSMSGSASKAAPPAAYPNNPNLSKDFINSKVTFSFGVLSYVYCLCRRGDWQRRYLPTNSGLYSLYDHRTELGCKTYSHIQFQLSVSLAKLTVTW